MDPLPVETLKELHRVGAAAAGVAPRIAIIHPPAEPPHIYLIARSDDDAGGRSVQVQRMEADPPPRNAIIASISAFPAAITEFAIAGKCSIVWYNRQRLILEISRRERVTYEFKASEHADELSDLPAKMTPRDLRKWLRVSIGRDQWGQNCERLFQAAGDVRFSTTANSRSAETAGKQSFGRDIENQVKTGETEIPEMISVAIRLFDDPAIQTVVIIRLAVDIDYQNSVFDLSIIAGEMEAATDSVISEILERIRPSLPEGIPLLCGSPEAPEPPPGL